MISSSAGTHRPPGSERVMADEEERAAKKLSDEVMARLPGQLGRFRDHPQIQKFLAQFAREGKRKAARFKFLLLRGPSQSGKSLKAESLFNFKALRVNCQGLEGGALPSIKEFVPKVHKAIIWDEINHVQVLNNKLVFQSGPKPVTLAQSACNAFSYTKMLYAVPHVLCSNDFRMENTPGQKDLREDELDWLKSNIIEASLPADQKWYLPKAGSSGGSSKGKRCTPELPCADLIMPGLVGVHGFISGPMPLIV